MHQQYPEGTVRALLQSDHVSEKTRQVLTQRLTTPPQIPHFFSSQELTLLRAICDRLIPQEARHEPIDMAMGIDQRLAQNGSDGWRYDTMPADGDAYKQGLAGIEETAQLLFHQSFCQLTDNHQEDLLRQVQQAEAPGKIWETLPANRFFEELLTEAAHTYYSHPVAQEEIGYVGMADVPGWGQIGLNQLEAREPKAINTLK